MEAPLDYRVMQRECNEFLTEHNIFVRQVYAETDRDRKDVMWLNIQTEQPTINASLLDLIRTKYTYNSIRIYAVADSDYNATITLAIKFENQSIEELQEHDTA